jgi:heme/copper-type cytochrome/quinol oxidase subunit 4
MNRQNQKDIFSNKKNLLKIKSEKNKLRYFKRIAITLIVFLTISLSARLAVGKSVVSIPLAKESHEELILVRQESSQEEAQPEKISQEETSSEKTSQEETKLEKELPLEEVKKSLEEEISERYEQWESRRTGSEISHSISAIATIVMTVFIALLGTGLLALPHRRLIIIILAVITVIVQFNINIFMLEKSLGGYHILEEQGSILKNKLKTASTNEEITEVREQFQELVLESINIE